MSSEKEPTHALYRSVISGEPLTLRGVRMAIVSPDDIPTRPAFRGSIRRADLEDPADLQAIEAINTFFWGSLDQDVLGRTYQVLECINFLATPLPDEPGATDASNHGIAGNMGVTLEGSFLHIVVFQVWPSWQGRGVARKLLDTAISQARTHHLPSIKLGTTNDNLPALYFYQRAGFTVEKVVPGEVASTHGVPPVGFAGIPVRDEIRLRLDL